MVRRFLALALLCAACGGTALGPSPSPSAMLHEPPTPDLIDLMMGSAPQATVFVVSGREAIAVTLLNHSVRYRLPLGDDARLATSSDGARLYVADRVGDGIRLSWYEVLTGKLVRQRVETGRLALTAASWGAIAADADRLYVLEESNGRIVLQAYDGIDLRPARAPIEVGCAGRVLASALRVAVVCGNGVLVSLPARGELARARLSSPITAVAMGLSGGLMVGGVARLERVRADDVTAEPFAPIDWVKRIVEPDGLAFADDYTVVFAEAEPERQLFAIDVTTYRARRLAIPNAPANGVLAYGQFAYWVASDASGVYHVDLQSGLVERMFGPLQAGATLAALAIR